MVDVPGYKDAGNGYSKPGDVVVIEITDRCQGYIYPGQAVGIYPLLFGGRLLRKISKKDHTHSTANNSNSTSPAEIADSITAACFPSKGEYIVPRKEWLIEWCRQLRVCR